ncbi:hypothetical protein PAMC26577_29475 [Caballeronia sordidicola]|uniref:Uncharacterized protein n=1 Tax=Caballeronia sordidicola TaxID=196367 RepID=A0A242MF96_CABSO|nr:hypothetical protein PAMC26577_29475 [Caballeronia sordidicola]
MVRGGTALMCLELKRLGNNIHGQTMTRGSLDNRSPVSLK